MSAVEQQLDELRAKLVVDQAVHEELRRRPLTPSQIRTIEDEARARLHATPEERAELEQLIAEQRADDTHFVDREHDQISLDAALPSGEGALADYIGRTAEGELFQNLPRDFDDRGDAAIRDRPGQPEKLVSASRRVDITRRFGEAQARHLASGKTSLQARKAAVLELPELSDWDTPPKVLAELTGAGVGTIEKWRRQNGGSIRRRVRPRYSWALDTPSTPIPPGPINLGVIKYQIHQRGRAERTLDEHLRDLEKIQMAPGRSTRMYTRDPHSVPDPDDRSPTR